MKIYPEGEEEEDDDSQKSRSCRSCRSSVVWYFVLMLPGMVLGCVIVAGLVFSVVSLQSMEFYSFSLDTTVESFTSMILNEKISEFLNRNMIIIRKLESDLKTGEVSDPNSIDTFEILAGTVYKENQDLFAFSMTNYNGRRHRLSRSRDIGATMLATRISVPMNSTYGYQYERQRYEDQPFSTFNLTHSIVGLYSPFLDSWYVEASLSYPNGFWETLSIKKSGLEYEPILGYSKKVVWRNFSMHSCFYVEIKMSAMVNFVNEVETDYLKLVVVDAHTYSVVGYRNLASQISGNGSRFRQIWELEDDAHFSFLTQEIVENQIKNNLWSDYFSFSIAETGWVVICHFDRLVYQGVYRTGVTATHVFSAMSLVIFIIVFLINVIILYVLVAVNHSKEKELTTAIRIGNAISVLDFESRALRIGLRSSKGNSRLMGVLKKLWGNFLEFKKFIPEHLYKNLISTKEISSGCNSSGGISLNSMFCESLSMYSADTLDSDLLSSKRERVLKRKLSLGLSCKKGVLFVFSILKFTELCGSMDSCQICSFFSVFYTAFHESVSCSGGILVKVDLGTLTASFNVMHRCSDYVTLSAYAASEFGKKLENSISIDLLQRRLPVPNTSIVLIKSSWLVGNLGSRNKIFHTVIGAGMEFVQRILVYVTEKESILFEKGKKMCCIIFNCSVLEEIGRQSVYRVVDRLYGCNSRSSRPLVIYQLLSFEQVISNSSGLSNEYAEYNAAWKYFIQGRYKESSLRLEKYFKEKKGRYGDILAMRLKRKLQPWLKSKSHGVIQVL